MPRQCLPAIEKAQESLARPKWRLQVHAQDVFDEKGLCLFVSDSPLLYSLSNYYNQCNIRIFGIDFTSSEQAYMFAKLTLAKLWKEAAKVKQESDPFQLRKIVKKAEQKDKFKRFAPKWDAIKVHVLRGICHRKFNGDERLMRVLQATGTHQLGEATLHPIFGIGLTLKKARACDPRFWGGQNILGKILMEIRDNVRPPNFILGDSLTHLLKQPLNTTVITVRGIKRCDAIFLASFAVPPNAEKLILHAGTVDSSRPANLPGKKVPKPIFSDHSKSEERKVQYVAANVKKVIRVFPKLAQRYAKENPEQRIVLSAVLPRHSVERATVRNKLLQLNEAAKAIVANGKNFQFLDASSCLSEGDYSPDGIHLNISGKWKLGEAFERSLYSNEKVIY